MDINYNDMDISIGPNDFDFELPVGICNLNAAISHPDAIINIIGNKIKVYNSPSTYGAGILLFNMDGVNVRDNEITGTWAYGPEYPLWFIGGEGFSNCNIENNIGISDGMTCFSFYVAGGYVYPTMNNVFKNNVFSGSNAYAQVYIPNTPTLSPINPIHPDWAIPSYNTFTHNDYGNSMVGLYCFGNNNKFTNENFIGAYPGWPYGVGCIFLGPGSANNFVTALKKKDIPLNGLDLCSQIVDMGINNEIPGIERCSKPNQDILNNVQAEAGRYNGRWKKVLG